MAKVGSPLISIQLEGAAAASAATPAAAKPAAATATLSSSTSSSSSSSSSAAAEASLSKVLTTPAVRRLAMENKVDLTLVSCFHLSNLIHRLHKSHSFAL
jgi:2-oxoisovalerate dehydrogenase E2 component (dihydrolipoyl transacylase)